MWNKFKSFQIIHIVSQRLPWNKLFQITHADTSDSQTMKQSPCDPDWQSDYLYHKSRAPDDPDRQSKTSTKRCFPHCLLAGIWHCVFFPFPVHTDTILACNKLPSGGLDCYKAKGVVFNTSSDISKKPLTFTLPALEKKGGEYLCQRVPAEPGSEYYCPLSYIGELMLLFTFLFVVVTTMVVIIIIVAEILIIIITVIVARADDSFIGCWRHATLEKKQIL